MGKYFGTDGIRGMPWKFPFTPYFLGKIGYCASHIFKKRNKFPVYLGMDSRDTGEKIKRYIAGGIISNGFGIVDIGIVTTPCLSYLTYKDKAAFGIMISASHNPPEFNGIKIFSPNGKKITDIMETKIENMLDTKLSFYVSKISKQNFFEKDLTRKYLEFILSTFPKDFNLKGYKICLDCANGGGYKIAPEIFKTLGAELIVIGNTPDGKNINKNLGALSTKEMQRIVVTTGAFCGISLDGDGDRCILSDENGRIFDGDDILSLLAVFFKKKGLLKKSKVVLTLMSNYGLIKYLESQGIKVIQVGVGDKNVTEALDEFGLVLGGESSGHIIMRKFTPTGDGILSSLWTLYATRCLNNTLGNIKNLWRRYPQVTMSLKVNEKVPLDEIKGFKINMKRIEKNIGGRVLVRYSGTEPVLRIMVEGEDEVKVKKALREVKTLYLSSVKNLIKSK